MAATQRRAATCRRHPGTPLRLPFHLSLPLCSNIEWKITIRCCVVYFQIFCAKHNKRSPCCEAEVVTESALLTVCFPAGLWLRLALSLCTLGPWWRQQFCTSVLWGFSITFILLSSVWCDVACWKVGWGLLQRLLLIVLAYCWCRELLEHNFPLHAVGTTLCLLL